MCFKMTLGPRVALNEEKSPHSTPATTPVSVEGKALTLCLVLQLYGLKASARSHFDKLMRKNVNWIEKVINA